MQAASKHTRGLLVLTLMGCATSFRNKEATPSTPNADPGKASVASAGATSTTGSPASAPSRKTSNAAGSTAASVPAESSSGNGTRPELGGAIDLQGYVGKYPIRAAFDIVSGAAYAGHVGDVWSGSYRYTGKSSDVRIEGKKADPDEPPDPYHPDEFACRFEERVGKRVTGTVEATCDTTDNDLIVDGTWYDAAGKNPKPFFLGPVRRVREFDTYYRALLRTPRSAHACAPYVRVDGSAPTWGDRELVSYVLHWPCDANETQESGAPPGTRAELERRMAQPPKLLGQPGEQSALAPVMGQAFLALFDANAPDAFIGAPLPFGPVGSDESFSIYGMSPDIDNVLIYKLSTLELAEPGPMAARGGWSRSDEKNWILPVDTKGRLGTVLPLPKTYETRGLNCYNESASLDYFVTDLDGKPPDELVVTLRENQQHDAPAPKGSKKDQSVICVDSSRLSIFAYRLDVERARLVSIPAPSEKTLESRKKTLMTVTSLSR
jgi:hypothetical protein